MRSSSQISALPMLPRLARTYAGIVFNPQELIWVLSDPIEKNRVFSWGVVRSRVSIELFDSLRLSLFWYVSSKSLSHAFNVFSCLCEFIDDCADAVLSGIASQHLINYRSKLDKNTEWRLGTLNGYLKKIVDLGYPGVEPAAVDIVSRMKLKRNPTGVAVLTMDVEKGPFTQIESLAISEAIAAAISTEALAYSEFVLVLLLQSLGSRTAQLACLKLKDLTILELPNGLVAYDLAVPRAKQRGAPHRSEMKVRRLPNDIGKAVDVQRSLVLADYRERGLSGVLEEELPLFPDWENSAVPGFLYHATSKRLSHRLIVVMDQLNIPSERAEGGLHCTSKRFRSTVATRAAEEGYGVLLIAELLDHSDIHNAGIYIDATTSILENIDRAVAIRLAPLAQAFAGKLMNDRSAAVRSDDPKSRIRHPDFSEDLGGCGRYGFCNAAAPIACYTCRYFQAWIDAPHEEVLGFLLKDRDRVRALTGDLHVAAINDRTILAVAQVIELVRQERV